MKRLLSIFMLVGIVLPEYAQNILTIDSCRAMALRNNKQLNVAKLKQDVAKNTRKALRTKYLPKIDAIGGYQYYSKQMSLLSDDQKASIATLGTQITNNLGEKMPTAFIGMVKQGIISPQMAQKLSTLWAPLSKSLSKAGNDFGERINNALTTDTRQVWMGSVMVRQPIFMGGAILAANQMADINEELAANDLSLRTQSTIYHIDHAYWLVVSLKQKQKLAASYRKLVGQLNEDVKKMIVQGVATRADGLKVEVKVNEADMQLTQAENGLALAKMLLCQLCGLPLEENIKLADEDKELTCNIATSNYQTNKTAPERPELRMLQNAIDISKQTTRLARATYLPHVALTGGYLVSNPNMFNGFQKKFAGMWNVGIIVQVPVWNWGEAIYKVRATKTATQMAELNLSDAQEKIKLQINQCKFKLKEARKRLSMTIKNINSADENLRCANLGFKEGVINSTDIMAAQTAWQQAQSQKIDAEIEVKLAEVDLNKALGILQ